jgi:hypothetical protein
MSSRDIIALCQSNFSFFPNNCSGFVSVVAEKCGVLLAGDANSICNSIKSAADRLLNGIDAARRAAAGDLVIGGYPAAGHGHVVVVVDGPLTHGKYPYAFWGQYRGLTAFGKTINVGFTRGHGGINYAFGKDVRDKLIYAAFKPIEILLPKASENEGRIINF